MSLMIGKTDLRDYVTMADEAIFLKLVRSEKDIETGLEGCFHPEFTHQLFGPEEKIFGYRDLEVRLWYTASRLNAYLSIDYTDKIDPERHDGVEPDDIKSIIVKKLETAKFSNSLDEFVKSIDQEAKFVPIGELIQTFPLESSLSSINGNGISSKPIKVAGDDDKPSITSNGHGTVITAGNAEIHIHRADMSTPGFKEYHDRMQTFLWWYIEAVSYIDIDDDRWEYFTVFEKRKSADSDGGILNGSGPGGYTFVGYATIYKYYAYPEKERPRISQVIILPPFQKQGIGAKFLEAIYNCYQSRSSVMDITVEEPSDEFIRLRDYVDCQRASKLPWFAPEKLKEGWKEEMATEARENLKLNKRQARRVYEILRLKATDCSNEEEYRAYRVAVKTRLNAPFLKDHKDKERQRAQGVLSAAEYHEAIMGREERINILEKMFNQLEEEYRHTIERLAIAN